MPTYRARRRARGSSPIIGQRAGTTSGLNPPKRRVGTVQPRRTVVGLGTLAPKPAKPTPAPVVTPGALQPGGGPKPKKVIPPGQAPGAPPQTSESIAIRSNAAEALTGAQGGYRDAVFRAALALGNPEVMNKLKTDPEFAGFQWGTDPNSIYEQLSRNELFGLRDIDEEANARGAFFSGFRLKDRDLFSQDINRQRVGGTGSYMDRLREFAAALAAAQQAYEDELAEADRLDRERALALEPVPSAGDEGALPGEAGPELPMPGEMPIAVGGGPQEEGPIAIGQQRQPKGKPHMQEGAGKIGKKQKIGKVVKTTTGLGGKKKKVGTVVPSKTKVGLGKPKKPKSQTERPGKAKKKVGTVMPGKTTKGIGGLGGKPKKPKVNPITGGTKAPAPKKPKVVGTVGKMTTGLGKKKVGTVGKTTVGLGAPKKPKVNPITGGTKAPAKTPILKKAPAPAPAPAPGKPKGKVVGTVKPGKTTKGLPGGLPAKKAPPTKGKTPAKPSPSKKAPPAPKPKAPPPPPPKPKPKPPPPVPPPAKPAPKKKKK